MRKFLSAFAILAVTAGPAVAQTAPVQPEQAPKAKTVKKTVCQRIEADRETGSRLGSVTRVCRTVEVPAEEAQKSSGHSGHTSNSM